MDPVAFATVSSFSPYSPPTNRDNHSSATPEPDIQAVPLEELPRLSTETQRRNGFRQSNAPDRSARIIEDISNGKCVGAVELPRSRNSRTRHQEIERAQMKEHLIKATLAFISICILYASGAALLAYHNKWHTQPYKYPNFHKYSSEEELGLLLGYIFIVFLVLVCLALLWLVPLALVFQSLCNLNETPRTSWKSLVRAFGLGILFLLGVGCVVVPVVGFAIGPNITWYHQMRNSCDGYDIRAELNHVESWGNELNHVFNIHNPIRPQVENHEFHLASRLRPVMHSSQPFQYYERFSGSSSQTQHIAVDVDIKKGHWRMLKLNGPDLENEWMADAFKSNKTLPEFSDISEELIKTGIFTGISPDNPHMTIPELDLVISNMHPFLYGCGQQPFLRVFNVAGKARDEGIQMASKLWTNKYDESIVMRTASFGHGSQRLDMCVKEGNIRDGSGEQNVEGMHDDLLIPMALISAARKRVEEMDEDPSRC